MLIAKTVFVVWVMVKMVRVMTVTVENVPIEYGVGGLPMQTTNGVVLLQKVV